MSLKPFDHPGASTFRAMMIRGHQVINIDVLPPRQFHTYNEAGNTRYIAIGLNVGDLISSFLLLPDLGDQRISIEGTAEFQQDVGDPGEIGIGFGNPDVHEQTQTPISEETRNARVGA